ncbi:hypothetical protein SEA_HUBBS_75 [Microbacterium phage Hubbs]|nr:hypothetical protein SEA_HUBBS_75 [Microbacterium phage Hubbs]
MSTTAEKNGEKKAELEHKVGLHNYAHVGSRVDTFVIIGAPNVRGKRWVTVSHINGGPISSYPEETFTQLFWVPNPTEK